MQVSKVLTDSVTHGMVVNVAVEAQKAKATGPAQIGVFDSATERKS